ncbi:hypothetical protein FQV27_02750 [Paracoccus aurantiacus]|uniref:Uncharacterized protein n=1 Tax=Paracoccus aurantiacus TaxID=2599412 RepID=A0A5C6S8K2_9RHOB|nr:hypothetical protein [Paracoccus aurantiacus]TXB70791.1 hypothetical protein FQV27_02750 [Paracoccus aurantiacus]
MSNVIMRGPFLKTRPASLNRSAAAVQLALPAWRDKRFRKSIYRKDQCRRDAQHADKALPKSKNPATF